MSIQSEITRIATDKETIRTKLVELNLASSTNNLDELAVAIDGIVDKGSPQAQIMEGETYTIAPGYYRGGAVVGIGGGGSYTLQAKSVNPSSVAQTIQPDSGYYGLSQVEVGAIPSNYKDVSATTAVASDLLANKLFVSADGTLTAGTMTNNGKITAVIDGISTTSYTVPLGYHNGTGTVSLDNTIETALAAI